MGRKQRISEINKKRMKELTSSWEWHVAEVEHVRRGSHRSSRKNTQGTTVGHGVRATMLILLFLPAVACKSLALRSASASASLFICVSFHLANVSHVMGVRFEPSYKSECKHKTEAPLPHGGFGMDRVSQEGRQGKGAYHYILTSERRAATVELKQAREVGVSLHRVGCGDIMSRGEARKGEATCWCQGNAAGCRKGLVGTS